MASVIFLCQLKYKTSSVCKFISFCGNCSLLGAFIAMHIKFFSTGYQSSQTYEVVVLNKHTLHC